jgi:hypothetical protein
MNYYFSQGLNADSTRNELLRTGVFKDMHGTDLVIKRSHLEEITNNFSKNPPKRTRDGVPQLAINRGHDVYGKAAGWIKALAIEDRGDTSILVGNIEWVGEGKKEVENGEWSFISAELSFDYKDLEENKNFGMTLTGAGLTNKPAVKGLKQLELSEYIINTTGINKMENKQIVSLIKDMAKDEIKDFAEELDKIGFKLFKDAEAKEFFACHNNLKTLLSNSYLDKEIKLSEENEKLTEEKTSLEERIKALEERLELETKKAEFSIMLSEGKAVESQREAFLNGDITAFVKNALPIGKNINLAGIGSNIIPNTPTDYNSAEDKIFKLAIEKQKELDSEINFDDAVNIVLSENKELNNIYSRGGLND